MKRDDFTLQLLPHELIIDNFAGGGGTSEGLEQAFGRPVDIAINHDPVALAMHAMNHPHTLHLCESVWTVDPIKVTRNAPVALVWLSPDCKHFSKAKGGTPVSKEIRGLAWVALRWAAKCRPRVIMLENVEEFQTWGPLIVGEDGKAYPDPKKKGKTFESFKRALQRQGYVVEYRELRACDYDTPTIRKRFFMVARRDGLPIEWPDATHGKPLSREVLAGKLLPHRTAAECIDWGVQAVSLFDRKKPLAANTLRRVAKGLWRHVLTSPQPFIVTNTSGHAGAAIDEPLPTVTTGNHHMLGEPVLTPFMTEHANASNQRTMPADEPLRTICAQVKGGHFSVVAPVLNPLRGTSEGHMNGRAVDEPAGTVSAGGMHHALTAAHLITVGYGERPGQDARTQPIEQPLGTAVAGGVKQSVVAAHLIDMGHGESSASGAKRWSHGTRDLETPLNTVTASGATSAIVAAHLTHLTHHGERSGYSPGEPVKTVTGANRGEQALVSAFLEQANGGFYDGDGRAADEPLSTVTMRGTQQRLVTAYCIKYYSSGGQWQGLEEPMHTMTTKARVGLVEVVQVPADVLAPENRERARQCAALLHAYLPEHFPDPAELIVVRMAGGWWVLADITLRMLKPRELFRAQGFPDGYVIDEIPDPAALFVDGHQADGDPLLLPRIPLTATAQVRMCGNSVPPALARALALANFRHERLIPGRAAA